MEFTLLVFFKYFCVSRFFWFLLLVAGVALEACGLYFQYKMDLPPCVNCVYERAYFLGFVAVGFIGAIGSNFFIVRFLCSIGFLASSIGGLIVSFEHFNAYTESSIFHSSCKIATNFPDFLPLDEIAPFMFKVSGVCSDKLDWEFLGQSMPFWILVIFGCSTLLALMLFLSNFVKFKSNSYLKLYK